ncbi:MAG: type ISP restriction/modification enzyme, partial [Anaerolineae bacterium]
RSRAKRAVFAASSPGVVTARDEWVVGLSAEQVAERMAFFAEFYHRYEQQGDEYDTTIKWSEALKLRYGKGIREDFNERWIIRYSYRPFVQRWLYRSDLFIDRLGCTDVFDSINVAVAFTNPASTKPFSALASGAPIDFHLTGDTQYVPRYTYDEHGTRVDNVTDWAVEQFTERYGDDLADAGTGLPAPLDPDAPADVRDVIFYYVYAVLHHPAYREKYALNLKREFPRIPLYDDLARWSAWGQRLLTLHVGYEAVEPYPLERVDCQTSPDNAPQPKLKAEPDAGEIILDTATTLTGVPPVAWAYRLGNRSAIEWVLEYHKERKPRDPTIRAKFDTYRFADHKERVIDLLRRVVTVSVETMAIVDQMRAIETV